MRRIVLSVIGFLALATVIGFVATSGLVGSNETGGAGGGSAPAQRAAAGPSATTAPGAVKATVPTDEGAVFGVAGAGGGGASSQSQGSDLTNGSLGDLGLTQIGPSIVKTADISVLVKAGGFNSAFQSATLVAQKYGGFVESSSTAGVKHRSGDLLIRVPSDRFDEAMNDLRGLGQVESQTISGQDVTSQFVDLEARLRTWESQESALLRLMRRASSIDATLRIQQNLQDVQFRIEEIKGQLRLLQNQTDLATIHATIREPGVVVRPKIETVAESRPSLAEAWQKALNGFLGVLYATVVGLGYLVPVTVVALAIFLGYRRFRTRTSPAA